MEDQVGNFLKQLAAKLELILLIHICDMYSIWKRTIHNSFASAASLVRRLRLAPNLSRWYGQYVNKFVAY